MLEYNTRDVGMYRATHIPTLADLPAPMRRNICY